MFLKETQFPFSAAGCSTGPTESDAGDTATGNTGAGHGTDTSTVELNMASIRATATATVASAAAAAAAAQQHTRFRAVTLADLEYSWTYTGSGPVQMGYISPHTMRKDLLEAISTFAEAAEAAACGAGENVDDKGRVGDALPYTEFLKLVETIRPVSGLGPLAQALRVTPERGLERDVVATLTLDELKFVATLIDKQHDTTELGNDVVGF
jgi:hypothetical protein